MRVYNICNYRNDFVQIREFLFEILSYSGIVFAIFSFCSYIYWMLTCRFTKFVLKCPN